MPNPQQIRVIDPVLSNVVQGYRNPELVGYSLFPPVPVAASGGQIIEFGKESFTLFASQRAPGGSTLSVSFGYQGKPYALENHSLEGLVPREYLRDGMVVPGIDLGERAVRLVMKSLLLGLENQQATLARAAASYPSTNKVNVASAPWTDKVNGNPSQDIETAKNAVRSQVGIEPNTVVLSAKAFAAAKVHPLIIDRFKYTGRDAIAADMLASIWDVATVKIGRAMVFAGGAMSDVWGGDVVVAYVPQSTSGQEEPSYGYTYEMIGHPMVEEARYEGNQKSWMYPVTHERAPVITGITSGYLIQNAAS